MPCYLDRYSQSWLAATTYQDPVQREQAGGRQGKLKWFWTQVLLENSFNVLYMDTGARGLPIIGELGGKGGNRGMGNSVS